VRFPIRRDRPDPTRVNHTLDPHEEPPAAYPAHGHGPECQCWAKDLHASRISEKGEIISVHTLYFTRAFQKTALGPHVAGLTIIHGLEMAILAKLCTWLFVTLRCEWNFIPCCRFSLILKINSPARRRALWVVNSQRGQWSASTRWRCRISSDTHRKSRTLEWSVVTRGFREELLCAHGNEPVWKDRK